MMKYLRLSLMTGFRDIAGRPVAWLSGLFGLFGIPGILTWANWTQLAPSAMLIIACVVLCGAQAIGGYRLRQDDETSLKSGVNERQRLTVLLQEARDTQKPGIVRAYLGGNTVTGAEIGIQTNIYSGPPPAR